MSAPTFQTHHRTPIRRRPLLATAIALLALFLLAGGVVQAITYGQPDGNLHPNVGVLLVNGSPICSGTYIGPKRTDQSRGSGYDYVFLTAAHCIDYTSQQAGVYSVSFDAEYISTSLTIPGIAFVNPTYNYTQSDPGDMAVVLLSQDPGVQAAPLPASGLLDQLNKAGAFRKTYLTAVGYGECGPWSCPDPDSIIRRNAQSHVTTLTKAWVKLSQNGKKDYGGTCYGDSGGPNLLETPDTSNPKRYKVGTIAALTVTGDAMCKSTNVDYRLDTASARTFLGQWVTLP